MAYFWINGSATDFRDNHFTSQNRCVITSMIWLIPLTVVTVWAPTFSRIKLVASEIGVDLTFWIFLRQFADKRYKFVVTVDFVYGCHSQCEFLRRENWTVLIFVSFRITQMNFDFFRSSVSPILGNQSFSWQPTTVDSQTNWIERIQFTDNRCHGKHRIHILWMGPNHKLWTCCDWKISIICYWINRFCEHNAGASATNRPFKSSKMLIPVVKVLYCICPNSHY